MHIFTPLPVTPDAVVGDIEAFHLLGVRFHQRAVHVNQSLLKERSRLTLPDYQSRLIKDVEQRLHMVLFESATEISSRCRVRRPPRPQPIQVRFIRATQFHVFQAIAIAQRVVGEV